MQTEMQKAEQEEKDRLEANKKKEKLVEYSSCEAVFKSKAHPTG